MSRKRKRLRKLIMGLRYSRESAEHLINIGLICDLSYSEMIETVCRILYGEKKP